MNKVFLMGNLGKDPEHKELKNGGSVTTFPLATEETFVSKGVKQKRAEWHTIVVWGKTGDNCAKYLRKGRKALVEGTLKTRSWEKDGKKNYRTEVIATNVQFLGGNPEERTVETPLEEVFKDDFAIPHFDDTPNDTNDVPF